MPSRLARSVACSLALVVMACGGRPSAHVQIVQPHNGDTVAAATVQVVLQAQGVEIVPATEKRPGTGHHHLFLDTDITPPNDKIPQGITGIVHLGRGQTEFTLTELAPGRHRLIAVVADADHIPLKPLVADTVEFIVAPPSGAR